MTQQNKNVPKLRFPEFSGEWENDKLGNYGHLINGLTYSPDNIVDVGLLVLRSSNVQHSQLSFNDNVYVNLSVPCENKTKKGDILICVRNGSKRLIGKNVIIPKDMPNTTHGAFMSVFRGSHNKFVSQWLKTSTYYREVHKNLGATINSINGSDLKKFKVIFPEVPEQQKIADFLSAVDERVDGLRRKKELLEHYKKGVMQKIFSQEIRFTQPDGSAFPDWKEKALGELTEKCTKKNSNNEIKTVLTNSATQGIVSQTDYFDKDIANQNNLGGYYIVDKDDFVYNPRISVSAPVGPIKRNHLGLGVMSPLYSVFRFKGGNKAFYERYFQTSCWYRYMNRIANFGARHDRMNVTTVDFYNMPLPFPNHDEQQLIADFLTSVDKKLEATALQLEQAQKFKKALLQQMFV